MPVIKVQHIASSSSEEPNQPAENLLTLESYKKWACASAEEKKAVVVLQLEKSCVVHGLDVGNNGSAFVEVLVGRSTSPDVFEVLLGTSTFMSVTESKQWTNVNRVRMFGREKFSKEIAAQRWDQVKIVCTQPYNKKEKYGLSFVTLHSPPETDELLAKDTPPTKLGAFTLKGETKDIPSGNMFFKRNVTAPVSSATPTPNAAAQARMASAAALRAQAPPPTNPTHTGPHKLPQGRSRGCVAGKRTTPTERVNAPEAKKLKLAVGSTKFGGSRREGVSDTLTAMPTNPLSRLMEGVVFALSGFKNPFRGQLRDKGVEMGALYQADWNDACTHLVCAFPSTPKFSQVKEKGGLIVKKEWILDSHAKRKRLPARHYRLSSGTGSTGSTSEDERYSTREDDIFKKSTSRDASENGSGGAGQRSEQAGMGVEEEVALEVDDGNAGQRSPPAGVGVAEEEEDPYEASTDEEVDDGEVVKSKPLITTDSSEVDTEVDTDVDTDDEIEKIRQSALSEDQTVGDPYAASVLKGGDPYAASTDEDVPDESRSLTSSKSLLDLPDLFSDKVFYFFGDHLSAADRRLLTRYIVAYGGHVLDYMNQKVTHVLTLENWDENFDQALSECSTLVFVKPKWVFVCHQEQRCIPYQAYAVPPR